MVGDPTQMRGRRRRSLLDRSETPGFLHTDHMAVQPKREIFYSGVAYNKYTQVHTLMIVETLASLPVIFKGQQHR